MKKGDRVYKYSGCSEREAKIQELAGELGVAPKVFSYCSGTIEMEYFPGQELEKYLMLHKISSNERTALKSKIRELVDRLCDNGIEHGDLYGNGKNILIGPNQQVRIIDYEMSRKHSGPVPLEKRNYSCLDHW